MESIRKYLEGHKAFCDYPADQSDWLPLLWPRARAQGFLLEQEALHVASCFAKPSQEKIQSEVETRR